jgi:HK97 family phage major capsid protein
MQDIKEIVMHTLDSNAFGVFQSEATDVNPEIFNNQLRDFVRANVVVWNKGEQFDFTQPGATYRVTVDEAPSVASALTETANVTIQAFTSRYVQFTPSEYGTAFQLSRKEAVRAFFDVMSRMTNKLGYAMSLQMDRLCITTSASSAGTTIFPNAVTAATAIASTDTLDLATVLRAIRYVRSGYYTPKYLFVNNAQYNQLLAISQLQKFNEGQPVGNVIGQGVVTRLFGLDVVLTDSIVTASSRATALVMGVTGSGEASFGVATKMPATIDTQYFALDRRWDVVGVQDIDVKVLHSAGICGVTTYAAV